MASPYRPLEVLALCPDVGSLVVEPDRPDGRVRCGCCGRLVPVDAVDEEWARGVRRVGAHRLRTVVQDVDHWDALVSSGRLDPRTIARYDSYPRERRSA